MKCKLIFIIVSIIVALFIIATGIASVDLIIHSSHWIETVVGFILHDALFLCLGACVYIVIDILKE